MTAVLNSLPTWPAGLIVGLALIVGLPVCGCTSAESQAVEKTKPAVEQVESAPKFGPLLGKSIKLSMPGPGIWAGSYKYRQDKYRTREIYNGKNVQGHSLLTLEKDQSASGCFAVFWKDYYSKSRYATRDGKDYKKEEKKRWLLGIKGKWTPNPKGIVVELDTKDPKACRTDKNNTQHDVPVKLTCLKIEKNDRLPVAGLLCKIEQAPFWIEKNGLDLSSSYRAGPWVLRANPADRSSLSSPKGDGPWLLLGSRPGLLIESRDERDDKSPRVTFKTEEVMLIPRNYLPRPKRP
ncbi:MAG: hypothetical protein JRJ87_20045 [Deltaproteobacteria bacterium]|nr:hypothetical protein [Deltaproteobacteria bacterium]